MLLNSRQYVLYFLVWEKLNYLTEILEKILSVGAKFFCVFVSSTGSEAEGLDAKSQSPEARRSLGNFPIFIKITHFRHTTYLELKFNLKRPFELLMI